MFGDPLVYRRRQRRRAIIAWSTAAAFVGLIVLAVIFGGREQRRLIPPPSPREYSMTTNQFDQLRYGDGREAVDHQLQEPGLPEYLTKGQYVALFPPHADEVTCTFWEISDELEEVARICFDSGDRLIEKLRRDAAESEFGVSV